MSQYVPSTGDELAPESLSIGDSSESTNLSGVVHGRRKSDNSNESDDEEFVYPASGSNATGEHTSIPSARQLEPSPAQMESLYAAASSGDLPLLKRLFKNAVDNGEVERFSLANHASSRTGFTALHAAANRGYHDIAVWLIEECGAMPDLEDREGETALHKAALNGHISIIQYLLPRKADVHARDGDGWTALHNACSKVCYGALRLVSVLMVITKGYLDIVRWLCEKGGATSTVGDVPGVDIRSKDGWTPLMNAASKGHLPVVLYLLTKQHANPLIRNKWGETAFDAAAAVFEVWICEILQQAEAERWRGTATPYNPLLVHTTLPVILYENQRLDTRLKTVAVSGGRPKFSAVGLGRRGRRAPFELKLPKPDEETGLKLLPAWRSGVQLPLRESPWEFPRPATVEQPAPEGVERSHFWLSDWTLDVTHPTMDIRNLSAVGTYHDKHNASRAHPVWVRRRRWVRIMRRRLDIPPLPFLEPDGSMYHLDFDGSLIPYVEPDHPTTPDGNEGQELGAMSSSFFSSAQDYVARARYLVGNHSPDSERGSSTPSTLEVRRAIAKLERATTELRQGILVDDDAERKTQAEVLLNAYSRDLERRDYLDDDEGDSSEEEFRYPGSSVHETPRSASRSSASTDYFNRPGSSRIPADLTPQLTQAADFRVPTHEAPQKVLTPRWTSPTPHPLHPQWERDEATSKYLFSGENGSLIMSFLNSQHHCRKCGRIFCDRCSSYRAMLDPADVVHDPALPEPASPAASHRVCQTCYEEVNSNIPTRLHRTSTMERIIVDQERLTVPGSLTRRQSSSQLSDLADCPVCNLNLDDVGDAPAQEAHVRGCLEGGSGAPQAAKYLVYRLPAESALLGVECVICLEEFVKGTAA
ncbi:hypothetical protein NLJ89_g163 [Agrocybe chaxingu]|uniref:FYVE-type domain-containing protein n=1 Tax=Agrocybe chaxingu TaxID=84603 RepID=A0A9W8N2I7_9AGAR|nr:hypothetical protein NLJ89_g163 [Agrocybe chaxingu]